MSWTNSSCVSPAAAASTHHPSSQMRGRPHAAEVTVAGACVIEKFPRTHPALSRLLGGGADKEGVPADRGDMPDIATAERRGKEAYDDHDLLVKENAGARGSSVEIQRKKSQSQRYKAVGWLMVGGIIIVSLLNMAMATGSIGMGASRRDPAGAGSTIAHLEKTLQHPAADDDSWDSSGEIEKPGHSEHFGQALPLLCFCFRPLAAGIFREVG
jgi:hypothetical protein